MGDSQMVEAVLLSCTSTRHERNSCLLPFFPSSLLGEGGARWSALALLNAPDEGSLSAETDPSPVTNAPRASVPPSPTRGHKGRGEGKAPSTSRDMSPATPRHIGNAAHLSRPPVRIALASSMELSEGCISGEAMMSPHH